MTPQFDRPFLSREDDLHRGRRSVSCRRLEPPLRLLWRRKLDFKRDPYRGCVAQGGATVALEDRDGRPWLVEEGGCTPLDYPLGDYGDFQVFGAHWISIYALSNVILLDVRDHTVFPTAKWGPLGFWRDGEDEYLLQADRIIDLHAREAVTAPMRNGGRVVSGYFVQHDAIYDLCAEDPLQAIWIADEGSTRFLIWAGEKFVVLKRSEDQGHFSSLCRIDDWDRGVARFTMDQGGAYNDRFRAKGRSVYAIDEEKESLFRHDGRLGVLADSLYWYLGGEESRGNLCCVDLEDPSAAPWELEIPPIKARRGHRDLLHSQGRLFRATNTMVECYGAV